MADEWIEAPLPDVIDFQEGPGILAKDFRDEGVPLVRLAGLDRGASILTGCNFLDPDEVAKRWAHFALEEGDILLSTSASLGRIAVVGEEGVGAIPYTGIIRMRPRDDRLEAPFLRYLLEGPEFQQQAEMVGVGSVIRHFGPMHLREMTVRLPPVHKQRAIAHVLGALDNKLELNQQMTRALEETARAIFKSWFVDFDPVRAKVEGRDLVLPTSLADLFPGHFVDSPLGPTPAGWAVRPIGEVVHVVGGSTPSTKEPAYWGGPHFFATPKDLSGLSDPILLRTERTITDEGVSQISSGLLPPGTVLLSSRAPIGYVAIAGVPVCVNQGFIAMICEKELPTHYVAQWTELNVETFKQNAGGTTFAEISKRIFRPLPVLVPPSSALESFELLVRPLYNRIQSNLVESETLGTMRDALLPKLMSGELRFRDAERLIQLAV